MAFFLVWGSLLSKMLLFFDSLFLQLNCMAFHVGFFSFSVTYFETWTSVIVEITVLRLPSQAKGDTVSVHRAF